MTGCTGCRGKKKKKKNNEQTCRWSRHLRQKRTRDECVRSIVDNDTYSSIFKLVCL